MRFLTSTFLLLTILIITSCEKGSRSTNVDTHIDIYLVNQQGQNLLAIPNGLTENNIEVYYIINGQTRLYDESNLDAKKGFRIFKDTSNKEFLRLFPNTEKSEAFPTTLIKFGNYNPDTIKCEVSRKGSSTTIRKTWLNNLQIARSFTIVK